MVVGLLFAWTFATLPACLSLPPAPPPLVFLLLVLGTPACSSSFARLFLRRQPSTPRLRGSDNGELALSSWFIASFDCQVHAAESVHPPSFPRPPRFSPSPPLSLPLPPCPAARPTVVVHRCSPFSPRSRVLLRGDW